MATWHGDNFSSVASAAAEQRSSACGARAILVRQRRGRGQHEGTEAKSSGESHAPSAIRECGVNRRGGGRGGGAVGGRVGGWEGGRKRWGWGETI